MAYRAQQVRFWTWLGVVAVTPLVLLVFGTLAAIATRVEIDTGLRSSDWAAVRFTVLQAFLSALASCLPAVFLARAISRRRFRGRRALTVLLGAPFILPVIVAVFGLFAIFGQNGFLAGLLGLVGVEAPRLYGLSGVVLAHTFFNLPLAARLILQGWTAIPAERFRLAASLDMGSRDVFRIIELPMLRRIVPGAFVVVFLVCLTSFAVALTLGGGPRATTVELAIYQAVLFDFELGRAALLAAIQLLLTFSAALLAWRGSVPTAFGAGIDRPVRRWDCDTVQSRAADCVVMVLCTVFLVLPLLAVVWEGLPALDRLPTSAFEAAFRSLLVAFSSACLTVLVAAVLSGSVAALRTAAPARSAVLEMIGYLTIAASPLVLGIGLFIITFPVADPAALALPVTAAVNSALSIPFAMRVLLPAVEDCRRDFSRLSESLDMGAGARLRFVYLPRLRGPVSFTLGLSAALSMGDLGVVVLFADPQAPTLPLHVYSLMAAYRMSEAASAALLLVALSFGLFWLFDRGARGHA